MTTENLICQNCTDSLNNSESFIECAECTGSVLCLDNTETSSSSSSTSSKSKAFRLCVDCFSCGAELGAHKRTHRYYVKNANEAHHLFYGQTLTGDDEPWSIKEELGLLDGIERFSLGNWEDIANNYVKTNDDCTKRTSREVLEHYDRFYLHGSVGRAALDGLKRPDDYDYTEESLTTADAKSEEVSKGMLKGVRCPSMSESLRKISADDFRLLAYMPQRDDFEKEFNNDAEILISNLMILPDDDDLDKAVKVAQIQMYIHEVMERERRKRVAREYDLVAQFLKQEKSFNSKATYSYSVPEQKKLKMDKELRNGLKRCAQFIPAAEFDQLIEDIIKERSLKERIKELQDCRQAGVTTLEGEKELKAEENSISRHQPNADGVDEPASPTTARRMSIVGTEFASGKDAWRKNKTLDLDQLSPVLSRLELTFCEQCKLSTQYYLLLKTALLREQAAKEEGLPSRISGLGAGGGSMEDILELKAIVKDFMRQNGWLPYFN